MQEQASQGQKLQLPPPQEVVDAVVEAEVADQEEALAAGGEDETYELLIMP